MTIQSAFIADDHHSTLEGLTSILKNDFNCDNVATFSNLQTARKEIQKKGYELYILDLEFKHERGFDLIDLARKFYPDARVIVHTLHEELWYVDDLLGKQVDGIIFKSSPTKYIQQAISEVMAGRKFICPRTSELEQIYSKDRKQKKHSNSFSLTPMELKVCDAIVHGYNTRDISEMYCISIDTVESHRKNIFLKMKVSNSSSLCAKLTHYGIIIYDEGKQKKKR